MYINLSAIVLFLWFLDICTYICVAVVHAMPLTSVQLWVDKILEPVPTDLESAAHVSYYQQGGRGHWVV